MYRQNKLKEKLKKEASLNNEKVCKKRNNKYLLK
jgi:hypothetical protein